MKMQQDIAGVPLQAVITPWFRSIPALTGPVRGSLPSNINLSYIEGWGFYDQALGKYARMWGPMIARGGIIIHVGGVVR